MSYAEDYGYDAYEPSVNERSEEDWALIKKYAKHKDCFVELKLFGQTYEGFTLKEIIRLTKILDYE